MLSEGKRGPFGRWEILYLLFSHFRFLISDLSFPLHSSFCILPSAIPLRHFAAWRLGVKSSPLVFWFSQALIFVLDNELTLC